MAVVELLDEIRLFIYTIDSRCMVRRWMFLMRYVYYVYMLSLFFLQNDGNSMHVHQSHNKNKDRIWLDGALVDHSAFRLDLLSHSLHYGSSVFEGIRAYPGEAGVFIFRLQEHIDRLFDSAKILHHDIGYTPLQIRDAIIDVVRASSLEQAYIRPLVFLDGSLNPLGSSANVCVVICTIDMSSVLTSKRHQTAQISSYVKHHASISPTRAKASGNYLASYLALQEAMKNGNDDSVVLNQDGCVSEFATSNLFIVKGQTVCTPPVITCLDGITRASVITIARDVGMNVEEKDITRDDLCCADEVFATGTARGIMPFSSINGYTIGNGAIGAVTECLQRAYEHAVHGRDAQYASWCTWVEDKKK